MPNQPMTYQFDLFLNQRPFMNTRLHRNQRMTGVVTWPANGSMVVVSGQVADDKSLDGAGQTADVLAKIDRLLAHADVSKADALYAYIWLLDIKDFDAMNKVWDS